MSTAFSDVKPFPNQASQTAPVAGVGHNRPPLDEMIVGEFSEGLDPALLRKIEELKAAGERAGPCDSNDLAGRYGDFIKMVGAAVKAVEGERERHNRPILTAQRALKAKADSLIEPLRAAERKVRGLLDAFMAEERRKADEARRRAEEEARAAQKAAMEAAAEAPMGAAPVIDVQPARVEEPVVRGDYGSRVGSTTFWQHEITSVRQLPDRILKHAKVVEAIDKVIAAEVRGGAREIKGCRIWSDQKVAVR